MSGNYVGQAIFGGTVDPITGSWNSSTALNAALNSSDITGYGVVEASFAVSGAISAGTIIFEVSDDGGTTWWPISGLQSGTNSQLTSYALTSGSAAFQFATGAFNMFRLRLNPQITGAGSVALRIQAEAFPYTTVVAVNQGTSPWVTNLSQFGGSAIVTGTGAGGAGIPRITVSNDSTLKIWDGTTVVGVIAGTTALKTDLSSVAGTATVTASAGVLKVGVVGGAGTSLETTAGVLDANLKNVGNSPVVTGTGAAGAGVPRVTVSNDSKILIWDGTHTANIDPSGNFNIDLQQVLGSTIVTAATGVQKVGVVGNAGAAVDTSSSQNQTMPANMLVIGGEFNTTPTTITSGNASPLQLDAFGSMLMAHATKTSYRCVSTFTTISQSAATDFVVISGSATKTIRVTYVRLHSWQNSGNTVGFSDIYLVKRSTADSGGTSTTLTSVPLDSADGAATAVVVRYSANPTLGTTVGIVDGYKLQFTNGANSGGTVYECRLPQNDAVRSVVLRGTAQQLAVNCNGVTPPGANPQLQVTIEWTEE